MVESLFRSALRTLGVAVSPQKTQAYNDLEAAYFAKGRVYHNLRHLEQTLGAFLTLEEDLDPIDGARATLALCYHDVVYDPQASDNEARSAAFARDALAALKVDEADIAEVERLLLLTEFHRADDPLGRLVVDSDLSILAAPSAEYDAYAAAIRREYAHVPDESYRAGRTRVLEGFMARAPLFYSPILDEEVARENMGREIERLRG